MARATATSSSANAGRSPVSTPCVEVSESNTLPLGNGSRTTSPIATTVSMSARSLRRRGAAMGSDIFPTVAAAFFKPRKLGVHLDSSRSNRYIRVWGWLYVTVLPNADSWLTVSLGCDSLVTSPSGPYQTVGLGGQIAYLRAFSSRGGRRCSYSVCRRWRSQQSPSGRRKPLCRPRGTVLTRLPPAASHT
jgi:hypothetical protein